MGGRVAGIAYARGDERRAATPVKAIAISSTFLFSFVIRGYVRSVAFFSPTGRNATGKVLKMAEGRGRGWILRLGSAIYVSSARV